jgi:sugar phosphate isomerase/epimerase
MRRGGAARYPLPFRCRDALLQCSAAMKLAAVAHPDPTRIGPSGHWESDAYDGSLAALRAAGYRHFELSRTRRLVVATAAAIRERAAKMGLTAVALHAPALHGPRVLRRQGRIVEAAEALGAPVLVFHVSSLRFASADGEIRRRTHFVDRRRVRALAEFAGERGLSIALENGSHPEHPRYVMDIIAGIGTGNLGVALDTGHANLRTHVAYELAESLAESVIHTHLHDNCGLRDEHLPPGRGSILWPRLASALLAANYMGAWCLELKGHPARGLERHLWEGKEFMERLFSLPRSNHSRTSPVIAPEA